MFVWGTKGLEEARTNIYREGGLVYNTTMLFLNNALKVIKI